MLYDSLKHFSHQKRLWCRLIGFHHRIFSLTQRLRRLQREICVTRSTFFVSKAYVYIKVLNVLSLVFEEHNQRMLFVIANEKLSINLNLIVAGRDRLEGERNELVQIDVVDLVNGHNFGANVL
jgi:hypothetical protein